MEYKHQNDLLVLVGGWNANIVLNPAWLEKHLFPEQKLEMKVPVPLQQGRVMVSADSVCISLAGPKLCLAPLKPDESVLDDIEFLAANIADRLPHTPVAAAGINFLFEADAGEPGLQWGSDDANRAFKELGKVEEEVHRCTLRTKEDTVNLGVRRKEDGKCIYDVNFHKELETLATFKEWMAGRRLRERKKDAEKMLANFLIDADNKGTGPDGRE